MFHRYYSRSHLLAKLAASLLLLSGLAFTQPAPDPAYEAVAEGRPWWDLQKPDRKQLLVWCDTRGGGLYHESVNNIMATLHRLGKESGLFDAYLRTDGQLITKDPIVIHADGIDWPNVKNLDWFDAMFFCGLRQVPITDQQKDDLISFVRDDGKGFVAVHTAITAFLGYEPYAEMIGSTYDNHPWGLTEANLIVEDPDFPAMKDFPPEFEFKDEFYQVKDFSREESRVLLRVDTDSVDMTMDTLHRTDNDFPQAWVKTYGKGRVFVSALGHAPETWDRPEIQTMYLEGIKWVLGLTEADTTPRPMPVSTP